MNKELFIKRLREGVNARAEANLDLWEKGYIQAYLDLIKELEEAGNKCVCTDQAPYKECLEHSGY